jgi:uncharacterized protein (DUF885 family)
MKTILSLLIVSLTMLMSCKQSVKAPSPGDGDAAFQKLSDDFIKGYLEWRPELSVYLGFHEFDGKTSSFTKTSIATELARLHQYDKLLHDFDTASLSAKILYDYRILQCGIQSEIFNFEDVQSYTNNPMTYARALDVSIYAKRNFAALNDRLKSIIAVEKEAPSIFATARINLADSLPKPFIETAILVAQGSVQFLQNDLIKAFKEVKNDLLMAAFKTANNKAIAELNQFVTYLEKEKLPKANQKFAIGREKYQKMLLYNEDVSMSPEKILEIDLAKLEQEKNIFNANAKIINPNKKAVEVYHDIQKEHPSANDLIDHTKKNIDAIRQFILDHKIAAIPSEVRAHVEETPTFGRSTSTASMDSPGPFEKKGTDAYFYVTPVEPGWTAKQKEDWLSMFDYYTTDIVAIHEVYPGHYTQFLHLNASSATKIEKIFESYCYIEGWAHYSEQMMIEEGYGSDPSDPIKTAKYRLAQSGESLLRFCRLCVSIKMHCFGMSVDDATKFFMDNWYQGEKPSRQEAIRGTFDPEYLYYSLGKLQILKLRKDYQNQEKDSFSLQKFHNLMLDNGTPPIQFLREKLLKDKRIWRDIL